MRLAWADDLMLPDQLLLHNCHSKRSMHARIHYHATSYFDGYDAACNI